MPVPVSETRISIPPSAVRTVSRTSPLSVYLMAFDSRLRKIAVSAISSVSTVAGAPSADTTTSTGLPSAIGRVSPRSVASSAGRLTSAGSMTSCPDSALATSRRSLTSVSSVPVAFLISSTWYSCSESSPPAGSVSSRVSPVIEFSGVRSSWLTLAQNLSLDADAARSCSDFSSSSRYSATTPRLVCSSSSESSL